MLTIQAFVSKVMSLLFSMLSRLVIAFLLRSKHLVISWLQSPSSVSLGPQKIKSFTVSIVSPSICHEVMGLDVCPQPFTRPLPIHASAGDSWTLMANSGSVSCGQCPIFLGSGVQKVLFVPFKSLFPQSCVSSDGSVVGLMAISSKRAYAIPRGTA